MCLLSEDDDIMPEEEEEEEVSEEEDDGEEFAGGGASAAPRGGGGAGVADDGGGNRSVNNAKGQAELEAVKDLGFPLLFRGYSIEAGIRLFEEETIQQAGLGKYGLEALHAGGGNKAPPPPLCAPFSLLAA